MSNFLPTLAGLVSGCVLCKKKQQREISFIHFLEILEKKQGRNFETKQEARKLEQEKRNSLLVNSFFTSQAFKLKSLDFSCIACLWLLSIVCMFSVR